MNHFFRFAMLSVCVILPASAHGQAKNGQADRAHLAMGIRIGEVTDSSAIVWARATARPERHWEGQWLVGRAGALKVELDESINPDDLHGAVPGRRAEMRLLLTGQSGNPLHRTPWFGVDERHDYVHQFRLNDLSPATRYLAHVEVRPAGRRTATADAKGSFRTAAKATQWQDVTFTVVTGQAYKDLDHKDGFHIYRSMLTIKPDFVVLTGDTVYYDSEKPRARTLALARYHWHRMYSMPRIVAFHQQVPGYWEKDDHDTYNNDGWPGQNVPWMRPFTFEQGLATFREQVPMGDSTYRTVRWGKGLQVWFVEGRDFRSPNNMPDGPGKTIWGSRQMTWLKRSVAESDADFKVLISPTPIVGPDRANKNDNHANAGFRYEGDLVRRWAAQENLFVCCGDRHWQYMSLDPATKLREFSCGPASDKHAGGTPGQDNEIQPFHRVQGGFLSVSVRRRQLKSSITFRFHDVNGKISYEWSPK